jgi:hypothetical protein
MLHVYIHYATNLTLSPEGPSAFRSFHFGFVSDCINFISMISPFGAGVLISIVDVDRFSLFP